MERKHYLKEWRELAGLTQEELGAVLNLGKTAVSKIESEDRALTFEKREAFAKLIGNRIGVQINRDDLLIAPESRDTYTKISQYAPTPTGKVGEQGMQLLTHIVQGLVKEYGFTAVVEAATKAEKERDEPNPSQRRRTS